MQPTPPKPPQAVPDSAPIPETVDILDDSETNDPPVTTLDTSPKNYYQAIGWLRGTVIKEEERYCVQIRDVNFPLYLPRRVIAVANNLEGQMAWMKCYPQSKGEGLSFKVVWMGTEQNEKSDPGIFVLRGVWQFIPQSRRPVFSIYRNELKNYENRPNNQHLPLIWSDQPPYRFRKDSEERPKFYQIMARLIPQRSCFGFVSQIADPLEQTPKRVKKTLPGAENSGEKKGYKGEGKVAAESPELKDKAKEPKDEVLDMAAVALVEAPLPAATVPGSQAVTVPEVEVSEPPIAEVEAEVETAVVEPEAIISPPSVDPQPEPETLAPALAAEPSPIAEEGAVAPVEDKPKSTKKKAPAKSKAKSRKA